MLYHDAPPTVSTDLYEATDAVTVLAIICTNGDAATQNITLQIDPVGAGAAQNIVANRAIPANDFVRISGPIPLAAGDKITGRNHGASPFVTVIIAGLPT